MLTKQVVKTSCKSKSVEGSAYSVKIININWIYFVIRFKSYKYLK